MMRTGMSIECSVYIYFLIGFVGSVCAESMGVSGSVNYFGKICMFSSMVGIVGSVSFLAIYWLSIMIFAPLDAKSDWGKEWLGSLLGEL